MIDVASLMLAARFGAADHKRQGHKHDDSNHRRSSAGFAGAILGGRQAEHGP